MKVGTGTHDEVALSLRSLPARNSGKVNGAVTMEERSLLQAEGAAHERVVGQGCIFVCFEASSVSRLYVVSKFAGLKVGGGGRLQSFGRLVAVDSKDLQCFQQYIHLRFSICHIQDLLPSAPPHLPLYPLPSSNVCLMMNRN